jgi:hypothetical protein
LAHEGTPHAIIAGATAHLDHNLRIWTALLADDTGCKKPPEENEKAHRGLMS